MKTLRERIEDKFVTDPETGCWLWIGAKAGKGYGYLRMPGNRLEYAHRASYLLHNGILPDDLLVCHTCDTPACINPGHLVLGRHEDNHRDKVLKGRHPAQKLTTEQIEFALSSNLSGAEVGRKFGVTRSTINRARRGETWRKPSFFT